jgi:AcrR family transcriptional regulator
MVDVVAERGYANASVELIVVRAGVSRRTFYACFASRQACLLVVLDLALDRTMDLVTRAFAKKRNWRDGIRSALASLLAFLDSEPQLARVWLVDSLAAGWWALEHRELSLAKLRAFIISSCSVAKSPPGSSPLAVEGAMASVLGVIHTHIVTGRRGQLIEQLGPMMGLVAAHYLPPLAVAREIELGKQMALKLQAVSPPAALSGVDIPANLAHPSAHRLRLCLLYLADRPEISNREIAVGIGVAHESQISKLLSRLLNEGLVAKRSAGPGRSNSWRLTQHGEAISLALRPSKRTESRSPMGKHIHERKATTPTTYTL